MNVLVTGASGFVGRNLIENLKNIRDGKNLMRPGLKIDEIFECHHDSSAQEMDDWCGRAAFVLHFAGVNRPECPSEYETGNFGFTSVLLEHLKEHKNNCPIVFASSVQASLAGRFGKSAYGLSKKAGEELIFKYSVETGAKVYVYRFPNIVGKWIKPDYNSAVATFCHNIANDMPIAVNNPETQMELLFIEDLMETMFDAMEGHPVRCEYPSVGQVIDGIEYDGVTPLQKKDGKYCLAKVTHKVTLGKVAEILQSFGRKIGDREIPGMPEGSFEKKLYSMFVSYLPREKALSSIESHVDNRGSFAEILRLSEYGQVSVNVSNPGVKKGEHWHNGKWEIFVVVSGRALIRERQIGSDEIWEYEVSGDKLQAVYMLPGYTHSIENLSDTENLVTVMWANERFDAERPDTFYMPVENIILTNISRKNVSSVL